MLRLLFLWNALLCCSMVFSQPLIYNSSNIHSHNDYEKDFPFWQSYKKQVGSIEVDIFLEKNKLLAAHDRKQLALNRTLDSLYLKPLMLCIQKNGGRVYADPNRQLQLMVDIKTAALPTLDSLISLLNTYPSIIHNPTISIVISGSRPVPAKYNSYPSYIQFDGEVMKDYSAVELEKIPMLSADFKRFSLWNGKGIIPAAERIKIEAAVKKAHALGKKIRFWNAPDIINSWYVLMSLGVDYINTDEVVGMAQFFERLPNSVYTAPLAYTPYAAMYKNDGTQKRVKNVILLIGDGTGLAQLYAGYTANKAALNVFNMRFTGLSKTSSYDSYITDSAPGSTAFSSGKKTNNRAVGVDHTGVAIPLLPELFIKKGIKSGIISTGDITDATPADFYAHQSERSSSEAIMRDLLQSPIELIMGKAANKISDSTNQQLKATFQVLSSIDSITTSIAGRLVVLEPKAGLSVLNGRGDWALSAFDKAVERLSKNKAGFFLMQEAAQVDHGGHANQLPWLVSEVLDFDKLIGKAMAFADANGETLVIVTADHETGGLSLTAGDYNKGYVSGQFSTDDHTAIPVPVFAYGPGSQYFTGVYENTAIFEKIWKAMRIDASKLK